MIEIYADGACSGNNVAGGGRAGAAAIAFRTGNAGTHELARRQMALGPGTNQTAELAAAHLALDLVEHISSGGSRNVFDHTVFCDSEYVVKGVNEWMAGWERNGWRTASKKPVANVEYWKSLKARLDKLRAANVNIRFQWVKGHATNQFNNFVDELAVAAVKLPMTGRKMPPDPDEGHMDLRIEMRGSWRPAAWFRKETTHSWSKPVSSEQSRSSGVSCSRPDRTDPQKRSFQEPRPGSPSPGFSFVRGGKR